MVRCKGCMLHFPFSLTIDEMLSQSCFDKNKDGSVTVEDIKVAEAGGQLFALHGGQLFALQQGGLERSLLSCSDKSDIS